MINEEVRHIIEAELNDDEKLLWADKPAKRPYPWRGVCRAGFWCVWMLFVSVFICIFVFGDSSSSNVGPTLTMRLIFISVGTVMFFSGYALRKTYLKGFLGPKYEVYGLTNKRAIVLSPLWKGQKFFNWRGQDHSTNFIDGKELDTIKIATSADNSVGTIIFSGWWDKIRYSWYVFPNPESPKILSNLNGFRNINNAAFVAGLMANTFGSFVTSSDYQTQDQTDSPITFQNQNDGLQEQKIREIRTRRVFLFSIFPTIWLIFTFTIGASGWLFFSFITFPFFIASAFHAIREFIRPEHSYRISS